MCVWGFGVGFPFFVVGIVVRSVVRVGVAVLLISNAEHPLRATDAAAAAQIRVLRWLG